MPMIKWFPKQGAPKSFTLYKPMSTLGKGEGNDIFVPDESLQDTHVQILFDGRDFFVEEADRQGEILINGKKKRRARLVHGDRLQLGSTELAFSMFDEPRDPYAESPIPFSLHSEVMDPSSPQEKTFQQESRAQYEDRITFLQHFAEMRKLHEFSQKLMMLKDQSELLDAMLDIVIDVTGAERGFIFLKDDVYGENSLETESFASTSLGQHKLLLRASRHITHLAPAELKSNIPISDSIVDRVISTKKPVIVSDALSDTQFRTRESVISLKLSSVMCAPLMSQGQVTGVLYLGNDRVKGLFDRSQLDLLSIFAAQASLILQNASLLHSLRNDTEKLAAELQNKRLGDIIGMCPSMQEIFRKLQKVATTDISVLITGETGTGKELIAREVHRHSNRREGPFVVINCGAIPENLIESELFGHVRGAFTGAVSSRAGKFQAADKGTLFLDEIGELPLNLQVKLLRALQERVVIRVGDSKPEKIDIRVVAATNRILEDEIRKGTFREDLYYRLNVVNLFLPPLRDRGDDVIIIAKTLLSKHADEMHSSVRGFTQKALSAMRKYHWPGNIRQLENRIKKALVMSDKNLIDDTDLELSGGGLTPILTLEKAKEDFQRKYILEILERNQGNRTQTARDLGVDPRTVFRYLEREPVTNTLPSPPYGMEYEEKKE